MGAADPVLAGNAGGDLADRDDRRVGSEDGIRPRRSLQLSKQVLLQWQLFRCSLNDDVGVRHTRRQIVGHGDKANAIGWLPQCFQRGCNPLQHRGAGVGKGVGDGDRMPTTGKDQRQPVAHQTGADDGDAVHHPAV